MKKSDIGVKMGISVIVPVFNGARTISELLQRLERSLENICDDYEVILVNDGSHDESWELIRGFSERFSWVHGIDLMKNYGQHNALLCGIRCARHERVVTMDDDLQHPPEEIFKLVRKLDEGLDVVYGVESQQSHPVHRKICSCWVKLALSMSLQNSVARKIGAFRIFRTQLRESFVSYTGDTVCVDALLSWGAKSYGFVEVDHCPRMNGNSNYGLTGLLRHALNNFVAFSAFPLKLVSLLGLGFTIIGICLLVYILGNYVMYGSVVPGFAFLASIIAVFSGVQLFSLGILGEYISIIHAGVMNRPAYSIRSTMSK